MNVHPSYNSLNIGLLLTELEGKNSLLGTDIVYKTDVVQGTVTVDFAHKKTV